MGRLRSPQSITKAAAEPAALEAASQACPGSRAAKLVFKVAACCSGEHNRAARENGRHQLVNIPELHDVKYFGIVKAEIEKHLLDLDQADQRAVHCQHVHPLYRVRNRRGYNSRNCSPP